MMSQPMEVLEQIYLRLGLLGLETAQPRQQAYVESLVNYAQNITMPAA